MTHRPAIAPALGAAMWMAGALLSFALMAISGRELSAELDTFQILFFRNVVGLAVICALLARFGFGQVRTRMAGTHVVRNVFHFGGQFGWFYGIAWLPLASVFALEFTTPAWTALLAVLLLGERVTGPRLTAIGLGLAGMLVILRPGLEVIHPASFAVVAAAICYALTYTLTKRLSATQTPLCIVFYMTVVQLPLGLVPVLLHWTTPSPGLWPWVAAVGVTALSAHYCIARAMRLADATVVAPLDFLRLPLIAAVGFAFYGEHLDVLVLAGAALMFTGNFVSLRAEHRAR